MNSLIKNMYHHHYVKKINKRINIHLLGGKQEGTASKNQDRILDSIFKSGLHQNRNYVDLFGITITPAYLKDSENIFRVAFLRMIDELQLQPQQLQLPIPKKEFIILLSNSSQITQSRIKPYLRFSNFSFPFKNSQSNTTISERFYILNFYLLQMKKMKGNIISKLRYSIYTHEKSFRNMIIEGSELTSRICSMLFWTYLDKSQMKKLNLKINIFKTGSCSFFMNQNFQEFLKNFKINIIYIIFNSYDEFSSQLINQFSKNFLKNEFIEGSSQFTISGWSDASNNLLSSQLNCDESKVGPLFGSFDSNIQKTYTNLPSHYEIIITIDILLLSFWASTTNYVKVMMDHRYQIFGLQAFYQISLIALIIILVPQNQKLITIKQTVAHSSNTLFLQIQSDFSCSLLSLGMACQKLAIKNLVIYYSECHQSCLSCNGPDNNQCLSCPEGSPVAGSCSCLTGYQQNNQCVSSCSNYYVPVNGICILDCSLNCSNCLNGKCTQCEPNYYNMNGQCVNQCPSNGLLSGSLCQEITEQSQFYSNYIDQIFTKGLLGLPQFPGTLTYQGGSPFSMLTGQIYSIYNNKILLGGLGVWADGYFQKQYNSIPAHNQLRIYLTVYFIDNLLIDQFKMFVDGVSVFSESLISLTQTQNIMHRDTLDKIQNIQVTVNHNSSTLLIKFQSNILMLSTLASMALSDIYIVYDSCDVSCTKCSTTYCLTCGSGYNLINQKCIQCGPLYNRDIQCACQQGFYDDGINLNCKPCPTNCIENSNTCQSCQLNFSGSQCQNCVTGYYLDQTNKCQICMDKCISCTTLQSCQICQSGYWNNNGQCTQCNTPCLTCSSASVCQTCQSGLVINNVGQCVECVGNNIVVNNICQSCQYNCNGCQLIPSQCLKCNIDRSNPPFCQCQDGFYESNLQCYRCPSQCLTCQQGGLCTQCKANRINSPQCDCPTPGVSRTNLGFAECTSCDLGVAFIQFSNDLTQLIIDFGYPLQNQQIICDLLFTNEIYFQLGAAPICQVINGQLIVNLDSDSTLQVGQELQMNPTNLQLANCDKSFQKVINLKINNPEDLIQPQVQFNATSIIYNYCVDSYFQVGDIINDGKRSLNYIGWFGLEATDSVLAMNLIEYWNSKKNYRQWQVPQNMFLLNQTYTLVLKIIIQSVSDLQAKIIPQFNIPIKSYAYEQVIIYSDPVLALCGYDIQVLSKSLSLNISNLEYEQVIFNQSVINLTLDPYTFKANNTYNLTLNAQIQYMVESQLYSIKSDFSEQLKILKQNWVYQIDGGNQVVGYQQPVNLNIKIINPNIKDQTQYDFEATWYCLDSITGQQCLNQQGNILVFNKTLTQNFEINTFAPYQTVIIQAQSMIEDQLYQSSVTLTFIYSNLPQVAALINNQSIFQMMNYYDEIYVQFFYPLKTNPDNLYFSAQIINNEVETVEFRFFNFGLKFRVKDKIKQQDMENVIVKFLIYNPDYFSPSVSQIQIKLNTPPQNCLINTNFSSNGTLIDLYQIDVLECYDEQLPLQFMFVIYDDLQKQVIDQNSGLIVEGVIIQNYTFSNQLITHLPQLPLLILQVFVKDSSNGISNFTIFLNSTLQNIEFQQLYYQQLLSLPKQNIQEVCSTIVTILLHAQSNKIVIEIETIKQIQEKLESSLTNSILTDQVTQTLILLFQQSNYINNDPNVINNNLNYLSELIQQLFLDMTNQFQYSQQQQYDSVKELNKIYSISRVNRYIIIIDYLYDINLRLNSDQSVKNNINDKIMKCIDDLTNAVLLTQLVNEDRFYINTKLIKLTTQKLTQSKLIDQIGSIIDNRTIIGRNLQEQSMNFSNYTYTLQEYKVNPLQNTTSFNNYQQIQQAQLYKPKLTQDNLAVKISQPVSFAFSNQSLAPQIECIIQANDLWSSDACSKKYNSDQIICVCEQISPVTLAESIQTKSQFLNIFALESISKISGFSFYEALFTYIILADTIFYLWFLYYGNKLDNSQNISSQNNAKIYPQQYIKEIDYVQDQDVIQENIIYTNGSQGSQVPRARMMIQQGSIFEGKSTNNIQGTDVNSTFNEDYQKQSQQSNSPRLIQEEISKTPEINIDEVNEAESSPIDNRSHFSRTPNSVLKLSPSQSNKRIFYRAMKKEIKVKEEQGVIIQQTELQAKNIFLYINQGKYSLFQGFLFYYKYWHIIFGLFYRYNQLENRTMRSSIIYITIMGQICITIVFGSDFNFSTILVLSLLQIILGFFYKKLLTYALNSKNQIIRAIGGVVAIFSCGFFFYVDIVYISDYGNTLIPNIWAVIYLSIFLLDYFIFSTIFMILVFSFCHRVSEIKIPKIILEEQLYEFLFGDQ
ncbi:hypothetical protein pb186bvf_008971 [Paramecium bursaria]